jgi:hypothetical protein
VFKQPTIGLCHRSVPHPALYTTSLPHLSFSFHLPRAFFLSDLFIKILVCLSELFCPSYAPRFGHPIIVDLIMEFLFCSVTVFSQVWVFFLTLLRHLHWDLFVMLLKFIIWYAYKYQKTDVKVKQFSAYDTPFYPI